MAGAGAITGGYGYRTKKSFTAIAKKRKLTMLQLKRKNESTTPIRRED
jgi:hypothetical protein